MSDEDRESRVVDKVKALVKLRSCEVYGVIRRCGIEIGAVSLVLIEILN